MAETSSGTPSAPNERQRWIQLREAGWRSPLAAFSNGLLAFLFGSGIALELLPFSVFSQHAVLTHTLLGLVFLLPFGIYTVRHVRGWWDFPFTHLKFTGWAALVALLVCLVSGLVVTAESTLGRGLSPAWKLTHALSTWAALALLVPHLWPLVAREWRRRSDPQAAALLALAGAHARRAAWPLLAGSAATVLLCFLVGAPQFVNTFPKKYDTKPYEGAGPFSPSNAMTLSGGAFDARSLSGSQSCGTARCHDEIYAEWQASAHRYSALDVVFQTIQGVMAQQNGATSTRYCARLPRPDLALLGHEVHRRQGPDRAGRLPGGRLLRQLPLDPEDRRQGQRQLLDRAARALRLGAARGCRWPASWPISCCAATRRSTSRPSRTRCSRRPSSAPPATSSSSTRRSTRSAGCSCRTSTTTGRAAAGITPASRRRRSSAASATCRSPPRTTRRRATRPTSTARPATASTAATASWARNQFIPVQQKLPGGDEQVALTGKWLRGEIEVPEIAERWRSGPAVPIEIERARVDRARAERRAARAHPQQQGRPRLPHRPARHHPVLDRAARDRRGRQDRLRDRRARRAQLRSRRARSCSRPSPWTATAT